MQTKALSILIVDDEVHARTSIRLKIDPDRIAGESVQEAADGFEALERIRQGQFDIILTDIRMPGMDGLELIEKAKTMKPESRFAIVSGFNDFDYARSGIRLGVQDYLLKPVHDSQLNDLLEKVSQSIGRDIEAQAIQTSLNNAYAQQQFISEQQQLNRLLGQTDYDENADSLILASYSQLHGRVLSLQFREPVYDGTLPDLQSLGTVEAIFQECPHPDQIKLVFSLKNKREIWAVIPDQSQDSLSRILIEKYNERSTDVAIGVGSFAETPELLAASVKEAQVACRNKLLGGYGRVYRFADLRKENTSTDKDKSGSRISGDELQLISRSLNDKNIPEAKERLASWLDLVVAEESDYPRFIQRVMGLYRMLLKHFHDESDPEIDRIFLQRLYHLDDVAEIHRLFDDYIDNLFQQDDLLTMLNGKEIIQQAIAYIKSHYREPITLESLAERYHIHPNYLCRLFKKFGNYNFNEYLTKVRMDQAYKMLAENCAKVIEVSEILGYNDAKYFSKVFKKHFGVSPSQLCLIQGKTCIEL